MRSEQVMGVIQVRMKDRVGRPRMQHSPVALLAE